MNHQTLKLCVRSITLCFSFFLLAVSVSAQCSDVTSGLREPLSSSLTNQGNLLVSETGNAALHSGRISIVDPLGNRRTLIDGLPSAILFSEAYLIKPLGFLILSMMESQASMHAVQLTHSSWVPFLISIPVGQTTTHWWQSIQSPNPSEGRFPLALGSPR